VCLNGDLGPLLESGSPQEAKAGDELVSTAAQTEASDGTQTHSWLPGGTSRERMSDTALQGIEAVAEESGRRALLASRQTTKDSLHSEDMSVNENELNEASAPPRSSGWGALASALAGPLGLQQNGHDSSASSTSGVVRAASAISEASAAEAAKANNRSTRRASSRVSMPTSTAAKPSEQLAATDAESAGDTRADSRAGSDASNAANSSQKLSKRPKRGSGGRMTADQRRQLAAQKLERRLRAYEQHLMRAVFGRMRAAVVAGKDAARAMGSDQLATTGSKLLGSELPRNNSNSAVTASGSPSSTNASPRTPRAGAGFLQATVCSGKRLAGKPQWSPPVRRRDRAASEPHLGGRTLQVPTVDDGPCVSGPLHQSGLGLSWHRVEKHKSSSMSSASSAHSRMRLVSSSPRLLEPTPDFTLAGTGAGRAAVARELSATGGRSIVDRTGCHPRSPLDPFDAKLAERGWDRCSHVSLPRIQVEAPLCEAQHSDFPSLLAVRAQRFPAK